MVAPLRSRSHGDGPEMSHLMPGHQSDRSAGIVEEPSTAILAAPSVAMVLLGDNKQENLVALIVTLVQPEDTVVCAPSGQHALRYELNAALAQLLRDVSM